MERRLYKKDIRNFFIYKQIIAHRKSCLKWKNKEVCDSCLGGDLDQFLKNVFDELRKVDYEKRILLKKQIWAEAKLMDMKRRDMERQQRELKEKRRVENLKLLGYDEHHIKALKELLE